MWPCPVHWGIGHFAPSKKDHRKLSNSNLIHRGMNWNSRNMKRIQLFREFHRDIPMPFSILEQSILFTSWMVWRNEINEFQNTIQHHFQLTLTLTFLWHLANVFCEFIRCLKDNSQNHSHTPNYIEIYAFCRVVATDSLQWYGENDVGLPENRATMGIPSYDAFHAYDKHFKVKWLWWFLAAKTLIFRVSPTQIRTENVFNIPSHLVLNLYLTFNCLHLQLNKTKMQNKVHNEHEPSNTMKSSNMHTFRPKKLQTHSAGVDVVKNTR